jgi:hypothetical protein
MFRAASDGPRKVVTGNRLGDGRVVFLTIDGDWSPDIAAARVLDGAAEVKEAEAYAQAQHDARIVVEPYVIDVEVTDGTARPTRLRERIRAAGPTVDYGDRELTKRLAAR